MKNTLKKIYFNPFRALVYILLKYLPNKLFKKRFFFNKKLDSKYFLISFDCDVQEDIDCLPHLLHQLKSIGIKPSLAIPGELIEQNLELIKKLYKEHEIEFINHGYFIHTEIYDKIYVSTKSYKYDLDSKILEDIELGHNVLVEKLNYKPQGFRAPHFGELNFDLRNKINKKITQLGYFYSSSTIYDHIILNGPVSNLNGIIELSVTGCLNKLFKMLDSWTFLKSGLKKSNEFETQLNSNKNFFLLSSDINYMNIYVDPSHIIDEVYFFEFLKDLSSYNKCNLIEFAKKYKL